MSNLTVSCECSALLFMFGLQISTWICNLHACSSQREQCLLCDYWTLNLLYSPKLNDVASLCKLWWKRAAGCHKTHKYHCTNDNYLLWFSIVPCKWHTLQVDSSHHTKLYLLISLLRCQRHTLVKRAVAYYVFVPASVADGYKIFPTQQYVENIKIAIQ